MQRRCNVDRECCEQCFRASSHITHARLDMAADLLLLPFTPLPVLTPPWLYTSKAVLQSRETPSAGIWNLEGQRRAREGGKKHLSCPTVSTAPRPTAHCRPLLSTVPAFQGKEGSPGETDCSGGPRRCPTYSSSLENGKKGAAGWSNWTSVSKPYPSISTTHNKNHDDPIQTSSIRLRHAIWDKEV